MHGTREFQDIEKFIEERSGIIFNDYNVHLLESQITRILKLLKMNRIEELHSKVCVYRDAEALQLLIDAITTNETFWFRDKALWDMLEQRFIPMFLHRRHEHPSRKIRLWSAACSYGQEPYSLAMCIVKYLNQHKITHLSLQDFEIVATDISSSALAIARNGIYDSISMSRGLSEMDKHLFFSPLGDQWQLKDEIRDAVTFQQFNLLECDYRFKPFDVILFKNVMIYFSDEMKKTLYLKISNVLDDQGVLFIGSSELLEDNRQLFVREQYLEGIYFIKKRKAGE
jgi:chemotaxis protein methyltransferase CheR